VFNAERLKELKRLPVPHYVWPFQNAWMTDPANLALWSETVRICAAGAVRGEHVTAVNLATALDLCRQHRSNLGVFIQPYDPRRVPNLQPTDPPDTFATELALLRDTLEHIRDRVARFNFAIDVLVRVSAIVLDCERWKIRTGNQPQDVEWNRALTARYDTVYSTCRIIFPGTAVHWYARNPLSGLFTGTEKGDSYSVPIYHTDDPLILRKIYTRAVDACTRDWRTTGSQMNPWIALGGKYIEVEGRKTFDYEGGYSRSLSCQLGQELHDKWYSTWPTRFAPWSLDHVCMWPCLGDPQLGDRGWEHFVEYGKGVALHIE